MKSDEAFAKFKESGTYRFIGMGRRESAGNEELFWNTISALTACEDGIERLTKEVAALEDRLTPLLRQEPTVPSDAAELSENSSPGVDRLRQVNLGIRRSARQLASLTGKLDL